MVLSQQYDIDVPPSNSALVYSRLFDDKGNQVKTTNFPSGGNYSNPMKQGSFELKGDRVTKLGTNM